MSRRLPWGCVLLALVAACAAPAAELPDSWRAWRYSRPISKLAMERQTPATIVIPWDLLAHSDAHGSDFRIIDERGQEVPYFLAVPQAQTTTEKRPSQIIERSFVSGQFTQVIVRITDRPPLDESHGLTSQQLQAEPWFNTYRVETPETDFMYWVETAVSDDVHQWRILDARSPISRFRKHGLEGNQTVHFEGYSNQRYLRIRILHPGAQVPVDGIDILSWSTSEPPRSPIPSTFSSEKTDDATETRWRSDLSTPNLPISELDFSTDQQEFYRAVRASRSSDTKEWSFAAAGEIYRFRQNGKIRESLRINFPENYARFWRVEIINGNDQPLANTRLEFRGLERHITFRGEPSRTYRLAYGNDKAPMPRYDFARVFDQASKVALFAQLGPEEPTSNYADPRPFTERHPNLLW